MISVGRKHSKYKRISILLEIDKLEKSRCAKCSVSMRGNARKDYYVCECEAAVEIRRLGRLL